MVSMDNVTSDPDDLLTLHVVETVSVWAVSITEVV